MPGGGRGRAHFCSSSPLALFSDGTVGDVDFSSEQWKGVLEPLNDPDYFA